MIKITVRCKPNSRVVKLEKISETEFVVRVNVPPVDGKANRAVIELLAEHFGVPKSKVELLHGETSKKKVFAVQTD